MSRRGWCLVVTVVALSLGLAGPAGAAETTFDDSCADVYGHRALGDLDKTTDPTPGSSVTSGQAVAVSLKWPTSAVAGDRAHRIMECLSVDKGEPRLWAERQFNSASGAVTLSEVVPAGLAAGSTVCSQSFLKTQGSFGPVTRWSERTCYPVGDAGSFHALSRSPSPPSPPSASASPPPAPANRSTPTTRSSYFAPPPPTSPPSSSGDYQPPWPPWEKTPKVSASPPVTATPTTTAPRTAASAPHKASGTQSAAPATRRSAGQPAGTLPRTGAGVVVLTGIAAVAIFSGRQLRKASERIADNLPVPAVPIDDDEPTLVLGRRW